MDPACEGVSSSSVSWRTGSGPCLAMIGVLPGGVVLHQLERRQDVSEGPALARDENSWLPVVQRIVSPYDRASLSPSDPIGSIDGKQDAN